MLLNKLSNWWNRDRSIFLFFITFYAIFLLLFFSPGQFWDWAFPYFQSHLPNYFLNESLSWTEQNLGQPMSLSANVIFRFLSWIVISVFHLRPEHFLYLLFLLLFSVGTFGAYNLINNLLPKEKITKFDLAFKVILSLAFFINPAIFYKFLAGHLYYFVSYVIFLWLIYFLLCKFKGGIKTKDFVVIGLFLGLVGVQFQFFLFSLILLLIYFLVFHEKLSLKGIAITILIFFGINLIWLSNFFLGVNSVALSSQTASAGAFSELMQASPLWIIMMLFSKATLINNFYSKIVMIYFGLFAVTLFCLLAYRLVNKDKWNKNQLFLLANAVIFTLLGTGFFHRFPIYPLSLFYPMVREVGHFAPIILLFWFLLFTILPSKLFRASIQLVFTLYFLIFVTINALVFIKYSPRIDYEEARKQFESFQSFDQTDNSSYRILTYPFWYQYGFQNMQNLYAKGTLINNSGWDSFIKFSGKDYIDNSLNVSDITQNIQYKLLKTLDITPLEQLNVKYLYDFTDIYQSNYNLYSSPEVYKNDIALIKNDKNLFSKLEAANPGKLTRINQHILKLNNYKPRLYSASNNKLIFQKVNSTEYRIRLNNLSKETDLRFLESFNRGWSLRMVKLNDQKDDTPKWCKNQQEENLNVTECSPKNTSQILNLNKILMAEHEELNGFNSWKLDPTLIKNNFSKEFYKSNPDGSIDIEIEVYFAPQAYFNVAVLISFCTVLLCFVLIRSKHQQ